MEPKKTTEVKPEDSAAQIPSEAPCYTIIYGNIGTKENPAFAGNVTEKLREGWTLYGQPFMDGDGDYCQAMTKFV